MARPFWFSEFTRGVNSTAGMAGREAGSYPMLELMREAQQLRKAKIRRDGRQGGRLFPCQEFLRSKNSERRKTAGRPFFARARDRRGAEQTRRGAAGPER
jgi:hypothetical protein